MATLARGLCHGLKRSQNIVIRHPIQATVVRCMSEGSRLHSTEWVVSYRHDAWRHNKNNTVIDLSHNVVRHMQSQNTRLSIAFKPAESGWGGGGKYSNNFDAIFKKKEDTNNKEEVVKKDDKPSDQEEWNYSIGFEWIMESYSTNSITLSHLTQNDIWIILNIFISYHYLSLQQPQTILQILLIIATSSYQARRKYTLISPRYLLFMRSSI